MKTSSLYIIILIGISMLIFFWVQSNVPEEKVNVTDKITIPGQIFYLSDGRGIYRISSNGNSTVRILEGDSYNITDLSLSPDGSKLVYTKKVAGGENPLNNIYVCNSDGSKLQQVEDTNVRNCRPEWIPGDSAFTFIKDNNIIKYSPASGDIKPVSTDSGISSGVVWSKDGNYIAYACLYANYVYRIVVVNVRDGHKASFDVINNTRSSYKAVTKILRWSDDGDRILFIKSSSPISENLAVLDTRNGKITNLLGSYGEASDECARVENGFCYGITCLSNNQVIYKMATDISGLSKDTGIENVSIRMITLGADWTTIEDTKKLMSLAGLSGSRHRYQDYGMAIAGKAFGISPNGDLIAAIFPDMNSPGGAVFIINPQTGEVRSIHANPGLHNAIIWSH